VDLVSEALLNVPPTLKVARHCEQQFPGQAEVVKLKCH